MTREQKQLEIEKAYFEKMKDYILAELEDERHLHALAGSVNRDVKTLYKYVLVWGHKEYLKDYDESLYVIV